jgi:hypothetical protein
MTAAAAAAHPAIKSLSPSILERFFHTFLLLCGNIDLDSLGFYKMI